MNKFKCESCGKKIKEMEKHCYTADDVLLCVKCSKGLKGKK